MTLRRLALRFVPASLSGMALLCSTLACDIPNPAEPAPLIGEMPKWGEGFETPTQAPASMLAGAGGDGSPGPTGDWSGGDAALGKEVWTALCVRCHGQNGEGGAAPGVGQVPALADPGLQAARSDRELARTIALGKKAMPSFMRDLDRDKLTGVVAYIRTLNKGAAPAAPATPAAPAPENK